MSVRRVVVGAGGGPEAAARDARYAALERAAHEWAAAAVLLGHTLDDQAETVLLRLARGSGARSLAAMAPVQGRWVRPLLGLTRADVRVSAVEVLAAVGAVPWDDPHNTDPAFARVRVRTALADLEQALGPGVAASLARTAQLLRDDADALDALADQAWQACVTGSGRTWSAEVDDLAALPRAVRTRVIRTMCLAAGSPGEDLSFEHVSGVERLVSAWSGQGAANLPGRVLAERSCGRLVVTTRPEELTVAP